jgi:hypothetical protein
MHYISSSAHERERDPLKFAGLPNPLIILTMVRRRVETTGHSVRPGLLFVQPGWIGVQVNCNFVQRKSKCTLVHD